MVSYGGRMRASYQQLHSWLSEIKYKPSFSFRLDMPGERLVIRNETLDADNPEIPIPIFLNINLYGITSREMFLHVIYISLRSMEFHELDEWYRINGVCYREPHEEKRLMSLERA